MDINTHLGSSANALDFSSGNYSIVDSEAIIKRTAVPKIGEENPNNGIQIATK